MGEEEKNGMRVTGHQWTKPHKRGDSEAVDTATQHSPGSRARTSHCRKYRRLCFAKMVVGDLHVWQVT